MGRRMDAAEGTMETYMTVSDSAMTLANDLRDTWSVESGKLSTVANLTAETDGEGNIIYYVSAVTGDEIIVSKTPDGEWVDAYGTTYADERVYVHWSQAIGSYIQQQASSITMSVMNSSGLTAAIKLAIERGESGEEKDDKGSAFTIQAQLAYHCVGSSGTQTAQCAKKCRTCCQRRKSRFNDA